MVSSRAKTVTEYISSLVPDRQAVVKAVRAVLRKRIPKGYEEGMLYGMIGYYVPLERYPETYNGQPIAIACLASQKNYLSLYLNGVYGDPATRTWFVKAYKASGKKLDMGMSCVRFKALDDLPLDVIGDAVARLSVDEYIAGYERGHAPSKKPKKK